MHNLNNQTDFILTMTQYGLVLNSNIIGRIQFLVSPGQEEVWQKRLEDNVWISSAWLNREFRSIQWPPQ